jgi:hypothetical protein
MAYEQKDNTGSLFKNDRREKDTHANARGSALIDGVEYWVDAWTNEAKDGSKYQSLKFKRKEQARSGDAPRRQEFGHDLDDDVPFVSCDPMLEYRVR